jgi:hypothetical protein
MSTTLYPPSAQMVGSLPTPTHTPSPVLTASNTPNMSRSSSYNGQESKRLVYCGQSMRVVLPESIVETSDCLKDVMSKVVDIHTPDENDVHPKRIVLTVRRALRPARNNFLLRRTSSTEKESKPVFQTSKARPSIYTADCQSGISTSIKCGKRRSLSWG